MTDNMPKHHMKFVKPPIPYQQQPRKASGGGGSGGDTTLGFGNIR